MNIQTGCVSESIRERVGQVVCFLFVDIDDSPVAAFDAGHHVAGFNEASHVVLAMCTQLRKIHKTGQIVRFPQCEPVNATVIDHMQEPLLSAGIFAISGPTGAGKSTLLDTLCLALFARTPRTDQAKESNVRIQDVDADTLMQGDPRFLLRRGTASGYAEADFVALNGHHYRSRWAVARARDKENGRLQNPRTTLINLDTEKEEQGTRSELQDRIIELIGLTFEQFTRSVLLAQNDFSTFLKADQNDKASLLEKLTGTELYSKISCLIYEKNAKSKAAFDAVNMRLQGIELLSDEVVEERKKQLAYVDAVFNHLDKAKAERQSMVKFSVKGTGLNGVLSPGTTSFDLLWQAKAPQQEKGRKFEDRYATVYYKFVADNVENLNETRNSSKKLSNRLNWIAYKDMYFSSVLITDGEGFESTTVDLKTLPDDTTYMKEYKTTTSVPFDLKGTKATDMRFYFGPNLFPLLQSYDKGVVVDKRLDLEKIIPLGWGLFRWINQYFVIPLFNFLGRFIHSYGILILLLTLIVKTILFPLTYKSYLSSAKMRVLRPQVEELNAKYPGQDKAMERQKATMELYSRAGASPMAGCVPMLLQMPIWIALFMFFPSTIELRHQSFLWAQDLSTYDAIVSWNANIPLVTAYFGNHISLFCLLMTITNIVYTKFNMDMTNTGQQQMPGMKAMMYLMPVVMVEYGFA